jgi:hypothetical protein
MRLSQTYASLLWSCEVEVELIYFIENTCLSILLYLRLNSSGSQEACIYIAHALETIQSSILLDLDIPLISHFGLTTITPKIYWDELARD